MGDTEAYAHEHKAARAERYRRPGGEPIIRRTGVEQIEVCLCGATRWVWITSFKIETGAWENAK